MNMSIKTLFAALMLGVSYINHIFSPLIWGLSILIVIDILLNVHKEGQQFNKIGSAFATLGGSGLLQTSHFFSIEVIHGLVAVMFLAYVQVVVPQILKGIGKLKYLAPGTKAAAMAAMAAELEALKAQAKSEQEKAINDNEIIVTQKVTP